MSIKKGRKIGFFAALAMLIGSVVGIGIFFKNGSVSKIANGNGLTWLLAWIVGGIIAAATAISFSEIGSMKGKTKKIGLPGWAEEIVGKKFGKFVEFNYSFFYLGALTTILGVFVSETILQPLIVAKVVEQIPVYAHVLIGVLVSTVIIALNYISIKTSGRIQMITTVIKFIPLLLALIIGIVLPTTNNIDGKNAFFVGKFSASALIVALPSVLFAYDAFMIVASLSEKVENGEKKVPIIILFGMIAIVILYTLIALSSILHNSPIISMVIQNTLPASASKALNIIIFTFVMISAFGVINGITAGTVATFEQNAKQNTFIGSEKLKSKFGTRNTSIIYLGITVLFWTLVLGITASVLKTDSVYDGASNFPTLFFFAIYGTIIAGYIFRRNKFNTKKINSIFFYVSATISIIGIITAVGYSIIGGFIVQTILKPKYQTSWGVFAAGGGLKYWEGFIIFAMMLTVFTAFPAINFLIKKVRKEESLDLKITK